ncbi:phenylalanine--tRNA ligase subunit beta [Exiguobacterium antarcticum]|uniref:phenylalanine--tRNA ligase subunit beta n=1 Tax=Exiguobacterium antarcticum TaxID=132920 RepID=UPI000285EE10|nr:phenylalanine--tRNA ligase subunit beta [Exiguobacterium antarcticum]AFS71133.1 Phenylalanine--tRNA ligase beta subunit [Exiguobacterium antarcticum B7]
MLVSKQWLQEFVDVRQKTGEELADLITKSGIEVEGVEVRDAELSNIVVGHVLTKEKHPEADKLNVTTVDIGQEEPVQIVCGAPNVDVGQDVIVARVGARLPGIKIKRAKLRGVVSEGMICSLEELGFEKKYIREDEQDGIHTFRENVEPGQDVLALLGMHDEILELGLTPNRSDCLSMYGVAHEVAGILNTNPVFPTVDVTEASETTGVEVRLDSEACSFYAAREIRDIAIAESPLWLKNRLIANGIRPINNVVDITNFVLLETGQPLHAFDAKKLSNQIVVRQAIAGETFQTLDEVERTLDPSMLVITDGERPVALAGVMGGANTEVDATTTSIVLESAYFAPISVRKTSRVLGLRSDSSSRFEKGVDPRRVLLALDRAATLIAEVAGGTILAGTAQAGALQLEDHLIEASVSYINHRLGMEIEGTVMKELLERLGLGVELSADALTVSIPTRRQDLMIPADLAEEVARLYGYDALTSSLPQEASRGFLPKRNQHRRHIRRLLQGAGLSQAITYSLTSEQRAMQFNEQHDLHPVKLAMPISEARSTLRTSLIPGLLEVAQHNVARQHADLAYYELGSVYLQRDASLETLPLEQEVVAGVMVGVAEQHRVHGTFVKTDFFVMKGIVETLAEALDVSLTYEAVGMPSMHPCRTARVFLSGEAIGFVGQVHPGLSKEEYGLKEVYVFELDAMLLHSKDQLVYQEISRFPSMTRDVAIVLPRSVTASEVENVITQAAGPLLQQVELFDVYTGENVGADQKSFAFSLRYQNKERTLVDEEVTAAHQHVVEALKATFDAELRA